MPHDEPMRERLILAGIQEIQHSGVQGFSIRRVASNCGVSCAAPYKHFADKAALLLAIVEYINRQWYAQQDRVIAAFPGDIKAQLVEVSMAYIRFLLDNPHFRSIIMLRDTTMDDASRLCKGQLSERSKQLIHEYCQAVAMPPDVELRKTFVVRSLIYGASLMLDNGELPHTPLVMETIRATICREFDLD
ncbi:MAG: TetR/AcrR family transcriptional regulator [Christensenellaceae bacterium]|jgi:AcrR family transcriptional regulator|nr:TetR/AcrR family transcriptional regulator [Christensenellaceae bacterium]